MFKRLLKATIEFIGKVHWRPRRQLSTTDQQLVRERLRTGYYIIVTHRHNHLSTFFVGLGNFLLTGRWGRWSHALMNLEDEVTTDADFRLIEATGEGTHFSPFDRVFDVDACALLKPRRMTAEDWTGLLDHAKTALGRPYDTLFNLASDHELSCVELVRWVLMNKPGYAEDFAAFEALIKKRRNLTPSMFYECPDFEVVLELRA